jgi:hypothetical protein
MQEFETDSHLATTGLLRVWELLLRV